MICNILWVFSEIDFIINKYLRSQADECQCVNVKLYRNVSIRVIHFFSFLLATIPRFHSYCPVFTPARLFTHVQKGRRRSKNNDKAFSLSFSTTLIIPNVGQSAGGDLLSLLWCFHFSARGWKGRMMKWWIVSTSVSTWWPIWRWKPPKSCRLPTTALAATTIHILTLHGFEFYWITRRLIHWERNVLFVFRISIFEVFDNKELYFRKLTVNFFHKNLL